MTTVTHFAITQNSAHRFVSNGVARRGVRAVRGDVTPMCRQQCVGCRSVNVYC